MLSTGRLQVSEGKTRLHIRTVSLMVRDASLGEHKISLDEAPIRIGRDPDNSLVLDHESVSRHHVVIEVLEEGIRLRDLGSKNGTWLLGNRVQEVYLSPGTTIKIGAIGIELVVDEVSASDPWQGDTYHGMVGHSRAMRQLFGFLDLVASTDLSLLLLGETGTGKEEAARAVHSASKHAAGPFVVFDGASIDAGLMGAALFGQREGAFTGASRSRPGCFQAARGGTLFLDEMGEIPLELQAKLLRALERREVTPLGSDTPVRVDARIVAATHRDLDRMVKEGRFREDLYHRLAGVVLVLPSLRERREDISFLVHRFIEQSGTPTSVSREAMDLLMGKEWPGNVRELRNVVLRALSLGRGKTIEPRHLVTGPVQFTSPAPEADEPVSLPPTRASSNAPAASPMATRTQDKQPTKLEEWEKIAILNALGKVDWKVGEAANLLGITRQTLRLKMRLYGITRPGS